MLWFELCRWERAATNICAAITQAAGSLLAAHKTGTLYLVAHSQQSALRHKHFGSQTNSKLSIFPQTFPYHWQTAVAQKLLSLASCACLVYTHSINSCLSACQMQALSFSCHVEASLYIKLGMSDDHNLLTASQGATMCRRCFS